MHFKPHRRSTLTCFDNYYIPRICAFHYSLDREFEKFIQWMKKWCKRTQNTFLDIHSARIHYPQSSMVNTQDTHCVLNVLQCNIERLRCLKQIHQDVLVKERWRVVVAPGVGSAHPKGSWADPENFLKHMKHGLVSTLKVGWGGLSPPRRKFLAPPLMKRL